MIEHLVGVAVLAAIRTRGALLEGQLVQQFRVPRHQRVLFLGCALTKN
jgi:hypothetical protein